jgi:hypothetical protein
MSKSSRDTSLNRYLSILQQSIFFSFNGLDDFIKASNKIATSTSKSISSKIDNWNKQNPDHYLSGHDVYEKEFYDLLNFDIKVNSACLILLYSQFEIELNHICVLIAKIQNRNLLPKDLNGKGIFQSRNYLVKVLNLNFSTLKNKWETIDKFRILRNEFVHQNGQIIIPENETLASLKTYKALKEIKGCEISNTGSIVISDSTLKEFSKLAQSFLNNVCDLLKEDNQKR